MICVYDIGNEEYGKNGGSVYDLTNRWVSEIEPQDSNLIFLPFLTGSNEDALAKGTFVGLTAYHKKSHMLRAVYEGIVFSHLTHVKKLLRNHDIPASIRLQRSGVSISAYFLYSSSKFLFISEPP